MMNKETLDTSLTSQISSSKKAVDDLYKQLTAKEVAETKSDAEDVRIASIVLAAMSKIRIPQDGKNGLKGSNGIDGKNGVDGVDGIEGVKGSTGLIGAIGKDGKDGKDGIGVEGSTGLDGKDGQDGKNGTDGTNGLDGTDGIDGIDGKEGLNGTDGINGLNGADGKNGAPGLRGNDGINGIDGSFGGDGRDGKKGTTGNDGKKGKDGARGHNGSKGERGAKGDNGRGIDDISIDGATIKFKLTDGKSKKVTIPLAVGGSGGPVPTTTFQRAQRVPYDNKSSGVAATNVQDALDLALAATGGPTFPPGTAQAFMYEFNLVNDTHSSSFVYNESKQLISTLVINDVEDVLYMLTFTYVTGVLVEKLITSMDAGDSVEFVFEYTDGLLTRKLLTYIA